MLQHILEVPTPAEFEPARQRAMELGSAHGATVMVLVTSDAPGRQQVPGLRPRRSDRARSPQVHPGKFVLVRAACKRDEYKGTPAYPYRKDPQLRLSAIPTLIRWTAKGAGNRLVEAQCAELDLVGLLLSDDGS
jgi:hypothetical protein